MDYTFQDRIELHNISENISSTCTTDKQYLNQTSEHNSKKTDKTSPNPNMDGTFALITNLTTAEHVLTVP